MYLIKAKEILTGTNGEETIKDGAILIQEGKIAAIGSASDVTPQNMTGVLEVQLDDHVVMPGLIDCHVHLGFDGSDQPVEHMDKSSNEQLLTLMIANAEKLLRSGVTTAREMGARDFLDLVVKGGIEEGHVNGPNLLVSARPITTTGGHCWFMGCECDSPETVKLAVRDHVKKGADWIKIMATGGGHTKGTSQWKAQFTFDELTTAVDESHNFGKRIAAHAHGTLGIQDVVDAGVDTIEHCSWLSETGIDYDKALAEKIVEKNIYVCPTTNIKWKQNKARSEERIPQLKLMKQVGVKFIIGTDAGIATVPHDCYVDALEVMQDVGMTNMEILESATSLAAEGLGIKDVTGTLEVGKRADIIAVKGNPVDDLAVLKDIKWMMRDGKIPSFVYGMNE